MKEMRIFPGRDRKARAQDFRSGVRPLVGKADAISKPTNPKEHL